MVDWLRIGVLGFASLSCACLGHAPLSAAGIQSPVLLGPVQALGKAADAPDQRPGAPFGMIALEQHIIVPIGQGDVSQHMNTKSSELALDTLRSAEGARVEIKTLHCKAFMHLFVRSSYCAADGVLRGGQ